MYIHETSVFTEGTGEASNLEDSASDIEKCAVEKFVIVAKGEAAKAFKSDTNMRMNQYPNQELRWIEDVTMLKQFIY